jgi:hypothetical protein
MLEDAVREEFSEGIIDLFEVSSLILCVSSKMVLPCGIVDHKLRIVVVQESFKDLY